MPYDSLLGKSIMVIFVKEAWGVRRHSSKKKRPADMPKNCFLVLLLQIIFWYHLSGIHIGYLFLKSNARYLILKIAVRWYIQVIGFSYLCRFRLCKWMYLCQLAMSASNTCCQAALSWHLLNFMNIVCNKLAQKSVPTSQFSRIWILGVVTLFPRWQFYPNPTQNFEF